MAVVVFAYALLNMLVMERISYKAICQPIFACASTLAACYLYGKLSEGSCLLWGPSTAGPLRCASLAPPKILAGRWAKARLVAPAVAHGLGRRRGLLAAGGQEDAVVLQDAPAVRHGVLRARHSSRMPEPSQAQELQTISKGSGNPGRTSKPYHWRIT